jgi:hypothetical protein
MYLAQRKISGKVHFFISQSIGSDGAMQSQDLFDLGPDPGRHIVYPGGNAFYIDPKVDEVLESSGIEVDTEELEDLFWPFVRPDIRRALASFRHKAQARKPRSSLSAKAETSIHRHVHLFDKRRAFFLRCGRVDQRYLGRVPVKLFRDLYGKSRDELEQLFIHRERILKQHEVKLYIFTIFNLQQHFNAAFAKTVPQALSRDRLDQFFVRSICRLQADRTFWQLPDSPPESLDQRLARYIWMYFDHEFAVPNAIEEFYREFVRRHRSFHVPEKVVRLDNDEAEALWGKSLATLKRLAKTDLISLYRRKARVLHPDVGGDHDQFVRLSDTFKSLLQNKRRRPRSSA